MQRIGNIKLVDLKYRLLYVMNIVLNRCKLSESKLKLLYRKSYESQHKNNFFYFNFVKTGFLPVVIKFSINKYFDELITYLE